MSFLSVTPLTASSKALQSAIGNGRSFFEFNGKTIFFNLECEDDYRKAYLQCAPLKAVVNRRAQMFVNGQISIVNNNNDNDLRGDFAKGLLNTLKRPNVLQTFKQWYAQYNMYIDIFGYCPVLKIEPVGMPGTIKAIWNLPPWLFDIEFQKTIWYNQFDLKDIKTIYKQFYITWEGQKKELDMNAVFLVLDNSIGTDDNGNLLMPDSRVKSLEYAISNDIAAKQAANSLITKKGAIGILSNIGKDQYGKAMMDPNQKQEVQDDFKRYGLTGQEWQVIVTDASLQWQSMSFPVKDLMLFETMNASMADICDGMGMYSYIMASKVGAGTTFTNLNEAKKSQYQDFIIPDAESRIEQLSINLIPEEKNASLKIDYSHVEVLQESQQAKAVTETAVAVSYQTKYDLGIMTRNQILEAMGQPKVTDIPEMDLYNFQQNQPAITEVEPRQANAG